jgi:hypothetical protein
VDWRSYALVDDDGRLVEGLGGGDVDGVLLRRLVILLGWRVGGLSLRGAVLRLLLGWLV